MNDHDSHGLPMKVECIHARSTLVQISGNRHKSEESRNSEIQRNYWIELDQETARNILRKEDFH